ncbi:hypothetical protein HYH02_010614 [Chlamydomonas schloesseri]|uniref:Uncharacterized protein n=1 Tax=Chlamydomonas schloesseri TaxID=2026947 RepID=A0A835W401_9CHLO|nr:hypothetical protein HYH02_010614 [Chlamydomonas schloesseri]|eukprot:KAG2439737.1 hypothetical protein HYH02_010614 [Chlamydomonas schloesseri]
MRVALALLLLLPVVALASSQPVGVSAPLLVWGSKGQGARVSYEVVSNVEEVASELVLNALGQDAGSHKLQGEESSTVVVFVGSQLDAADMRSRTEAVDALSGLVNAAPASLVMPYTVSKGASIRENVCGKLDAAGVQHEVVACKAPSADLKADVAAALAKANGAKKHVVIACSNIDAALEGTNAGLAAEVEQLQQVQAAVDAAGLDAVVLYASQSAPGASDLAAAQGGKRRSLLATYTGFGEYTSCGTLCQTQVRWLEAMLAVLFMALASCAGLLCLYVLDTPTRFETAKDAASGPQN